MYRSAKSLLHYLVIPKIEINRKFCSSNAFQARWPLLKDITRLRVVKIKTSTLHIVISSNFEFWTSPGLSSNPKNRAVGLHSLVQHKLNYLPSKSFFILSILLDIFDEVFPFLNTFLEFLEVSRCSRFSTL